MATERAQETICRIVKDRILELETKAGRKPFYNGVVVIEDTLLVIDENAWDLQLYSRRDGKLLSTSHRLKSIPWGVCLISKTEVAVCLNNSKIVILSFKSIDDVKRVKTLDVRTGFDECDSVAKLNSMDKLVVSGRNYDDDYDMFCWGVVSITDGRLDSTQNICKGGLGSGRSHLAIKNNTVYISCWTNDSTTNGVYAYDIFNPHTHKFLYQHQEWIPFSIIAERDYVYVSDWNSNRIHQLTDSGQLVTIHTVSSIPDEIFYDDQHGVLYITNKDSNVITVYRMEYLHQPGVPIEILKMDDRSIQLFEEALKDGKETVHSIRIMVVGHMGVGKTTLVKRLLGEEVNISQRHITEGIDVYVNCCDVSLSTHEWTRRTKDLGQDYRLQRIFKVLKEQQSVKDKVTDEQVIIPSEGDRTESLEVSHAAVEDQNAEVLHHHSSEQDIGQDLSSTTNQQKESTAHQQEDSSSAVVQKKPTQSETNTTAMLKLLKENVNKLEGTGENALLTIWDFAGQYAFYTTHQTFLTRRAIYLLVSDVSGQVTDLVADDCYFDSDGIMKCQVHELVEVWLNSIHSCASSPEAGSPPVILVGTHVDKISQKLSPAKGKASETQITASEAVEFTQLTTLTPAATSASEQPRASTISDAVKKFVQPQKTEGILEVTPVTSMAGAHAIPAEDHLKKHKKYSWLKGRKKKKVKMAVMAAPSTEESVGKAVMGADAAKGKNHEICKRYFRQVRSYLKDKPTRFHLIDEDFAIDNTVVDRKLEDLKRKIVEVASQQPYWGEEIPARWLPLEQELMRRKDAGVKVISLGDVEKINKEGTVKIENGEELVLFLRFLHETGTIIYFSTEVLRGNIVLDPTWLIDALKSLINAQSDLPVHVCSADNGTQSSSPADNGSQSNIPSGSDAGSDVTQKWSDFKEKGILTLELVDAVWTKEKFPTLHAKRDFMLLLMQQLNIIAKPRAFSEIDEKEESYYLTPCMLRQESPREVISPEPDPQMASTPLLRCVFTGKFLPTPIFHRLLAACISRWPVAKTKDTSENLIFCGCCVFNLDLFHRLTLYFKNHVVFARITRMVIGEVSTPDAKLCSRVRRFITLNLSKITSYLGQNLQYELHVCPPFHMWLADEGHDPDAPIAPEHMNHARLCVALVTVCGSALRDILLSKFPVPYTDIYQAILANKGSLTSRQGRPLLNPDQCRLVFPDPQRQKTGTVHQFDLSLLYTLIRNVSTVPAPITGWGSDPQDQPVRDISLGASVERIRSYRNHIIGHSMDGKISRQGLEDYWSKFDAVLHDIETILGGHVYTQDLVKQKRQLISIYEAC